MSVRDYLEATEIDRRGQRYVLGRTSEGYAIWNAGLGGRPLRRFPGTLPGEAEARYAFEQLEGGTPVFGGPGGEWYEARTAEWTVGRAMELRPMTVGGILDGAFKLYRLKFWTLVAVVALVVVPVQAVILGVTLATLEPVALPTIPGGPSLIVGQASPSIPVGAALVQVLFVAPVLTAAVVKVAADTAMGRLATVSSASGMALRRAHSILWVTLLTALASVVLIALPVIAAIALRPVPDGTGAPVALVLMLLGLVPAIFFLVRFMLAPCAVMVEDVKGISALMRSWQLLRGRTWKALGTFLLAILLLVVLSVILTFVLSFAIGLLLAIFFRDALLSGGLWSLLYSMQAFVNTTVGILTTPYLTLVIVLLYLDARMRKEGADLAAIARRILP